MASSYRRLTLLSRQHTWRARCSSVPLHKSVEAVTWGYDRLIGLVLLYHVLSLLIINCANYRFVCSIYTYRLSQLSTVIMTYNIVNVQRPFPRPHTHTHTPQPHTLPPFFCRTAKTAVWRLKKACELKHDHHQGDRHSTKAREHADCTCPILTHIKNFKNFESEGNINETFAHLSPSMGNLTFAYICHLAGEILPDYTSPFLTLRLCLPTIAKTAGSMCTGNGDTELATVLMMFPIKRPRVAPTYLHDKRKLAISADLSLWIQSMSSEASLSYILYNRNLGRIIYNNICACLLSIKG